MLGAHSGDDYFGSPIEGLRLSPATRTQTRGLGAGGHLPPRIPGQTSQGCYVMLNKGGRPAPIHLYTPDHGGCGGHSLQCDRRGRQDDLHNGFPRGQSGAPLRLGGGAQRGGTVRYTATVTVATGTPSPGLNAEVANRAPKPVGFARAHGPAPRFCFAQRSG